MTDWPKMETPRRVATEAGIARFEKRIGAALPADYRQFLLERNGGQPEEARCTFAVGNGRATVNSLHSLDAEQERFDLLTRWELSRDKLPAELLPVGNDDGGGVIAIAVAGSHKGEVWFTTNSRPSESNLRVDWFERRDVVRVAAAFHEFIGELEPYNQP